MFAQSGFAGREGHNSPAQSCGKRELLGAWEKRSLAPRLPLDGLAPDTISQHLLAHRWGEHAWRPLDNCISCATGGCA